MVLNSLQVDDMPLCIDRLSLLRHHGPPGGRVENQCCRRNLVPAEPKVLGSANRAGRSIGMDIVQKYGFAITVQLRQKVERSNAAFADRVELDLKPGGRGLLVFG